MSNPQFLFITTAVVVNAYVLLWTYFNTVDQVQEIAHLEWKYNRLITSTEALEQKMKVLWKSALLDRDRTIAASFEISNSTSHD
jgi:hypothetical protein